eukprot:SAG22_NODE_1890_length_3373_cov_1.512523_2_plen_775_part_00
MTLRVCIPTQTKGSLFVLSRTAVVLADSSWEATQHWAVSLNRNFIENKEVGSWLWSLIYSWYGGIVYDGKGFLKANTPWSGRYSLSPFVYVTMQHTQFHHVGWRYLNASAVLSPANASDKFCFNSSPPPHRTDSHWKANFSRCVARAPSFIALVSPDGHDLSVVVETATVAADTVLAPLVFMLSGALKQQWAGKRLACRQTTKTTNFVALPDVAVSADGTFAVPLVGDAVISVSSRHDQHDGTATLSRPSKPDTDFPLPYSDGFDNYANDSLPKYLSAWNGAFAIAKAADGESVLRQYVTDPPTPWSSEHVPVARGTCVDGRGDFPGCTGAVAILGSANWSAPFEMNVSIRVPPAAAVPDLLQPVNSTTAAVAFVSLLWNTEFSDGPTLELRPELHRWDLACGRKRALSWTWLAGGTSKHITPARWMQVRFGIGAAANTTGLLSASINGDEIFAGVQLRCKGLMRGFAAVGTHLNLADFDNLSIAQGKQLQSQPQLEGDDDDDDVQKVLASASEHQRERSASRTGSSPSPSGGANELDAAATRPPIEPPAGHHGSHLTATVGVDWSAPAAVGVTSAAATVEVDVMPFMSRNGGPNRTRDNNSSLGGPFEAYFSALQDLGSDYTRFAPWFGYPKTIVAELRRPNCSAGSPVGAGWNSSIMDGILADFMAANGPNRTVAMQISTVPSWMVVGGTDPDSLPEDPWSYDEWGSYNKGDKLVDETCGELATYIARMTAWYTQGGMTDACGKYRHSGFHYKWAALSVLNNDPPLDTTANL